LHPEAVEEAFPELEEVECGDRGAVAEVHF
jgi:hypothetical protein